MAQLSIDRLYFEIRAAKLGKMRVRHQQHVELQSGVQLTVTEIYNFLFSTDMSIIVVML